MVSAGNPSCYSLVAAPLIANRFPAIRPAVSYVDGGTLFVKNRNGKVLFEERVERLSVKLTRVGTCVLSTADGGYYRMTPGQTGNERANERLLSQVPEHIRLPGDTGFAREFTGDPTADTLATTVLTGDAGAKMRNLVDALERGGASVSSRERFSLLAVWTYVALILGGFAVLVFLLFLAFG